MKDSTRDLPDVSARPQQDITGALDWVGMAGIQMPLRFDAGDGREVVAAATTDAFVNLTRAEQRGIHMSRLYLATIETLSGQPLSPASLRATLAEYITSQQGAADRARLTLHFAHLVERPAMSSRHSGWRTYPVTVEAQLTGDALTVDLTTEILYSSTCPASAALARQLVQQQFAADFTAGATLDRAAVLAWLGSERGMIATPHAQRSQARITVRLAPDAPLHWLGLLDVVEAALGTPVQTVVKREDEQAFARANGGNLMFCEDAVRRIRLALLPDVAWADFHLRVEHRESLHAHDAVAYASKRA